MAAQIIDGKAVAADLRGEIAERISALTSEGAQPPGLAVVLVGEDPASQVYVKNKAKQTVEVGMTSFEHRLSAETSQADLLALVRKLNADPAVHGILVQLPLPKGIDEATVLNAIAPEKDVDGFHPVNVGKFWSGIPGALVPCTPTGCLMLLTRTLGDISGANAVVVGRSNIVGKPMAGLLLGANCSVTIAHSRTQDLPAVCREADILIAAVGRPQMVLGDWIKPGASVIDVGINRIPKEDGSGTRLVGDVHFDQAKEVAGSITPVPGGVGPMTIACLLHNTLTAYGNMSS